MLEHHLCAGSSACHQGDIAVDASHVTYLARGALHLADGDAKRASTLVQAAIRATACWERGRLWTTDAICDDQVDQQMGRLGLAAPDDDGWLEFLARYDLSGPVDPFPARGGAHDEELLHRAAEHAATTPTLLVSNDEDLLLQAQQRMIQSEIDLTPVNSTDAMLRLLDCGAFPPRFVESCLVAEYANVEDMMRSGGMGREKAHRKFGRLQIANNAIAIKKYDAT